jgi:hypothetical protein
MTTNEDMQELLPTKKLRERVANESKYVASWDVPNNNNVKRRNKNKTTTSEEAKREGQARASLIQKYDGSEESEEYWRTRR